MLKVYASFRAEFVKKKTVLATVCIEIPKRKTHLSKSFTHTDVVGSLHASEEAAFIYPHIIEEHHDTSNETNFLSRRCGANGGFADSTTGDGDRGP